MAADKQMWSEQQIALCRKYGAKPMAVAASDRLAITRNIRTGVLPIRGFRVLPHEGMCGWWIWAGGEYPTDVDAFDPLHVSHLDSWCPAAVPLLMLPPGWCFVVAPGHEDVWFNPDLYLTPWIRKTQ